ncbi:MAG: SPASM domain-containing protein, partial [Candidatus Omnitrophica bacterium]|nr:SPASM domain-containing protein [Candidatus Omnitrophota bacterium]
VKMGTDYNLSPFSAARNVPGTAGTNLNQMTKGCLAATGICFVSHQGEVFPCGYLPISCGSVKTSTLKEAWVYSSVFRNLRDPELLEGKCGVCEFKRICSGCRARAYEEECDFLAEEPNCSYEPKRFLFSVPPKNFSK